MGLGPLALRILAAAAAIAAALWLMRLALRRPSSNLAVLSGACVALAGWAVTAALGAAPLLLTPLLAHRWPLRARMHLVGSGFLGLALLLLPWALARA